MLAEKPFVSWEDVFADERKRRGIIACFLAMLELTKLQKIFICQEDNFAKIVIYRKEADADEPVPAAGDAGHAAGPAAADAGEPVSPGG